MTNPVSDYGFATEPSFALHTALIPRQVAVQYWTILKRIIARRRQAQPGMIFSMLSNSGQQSVQIGIKFKMRRICESKELFLESIETWTF
jgi:hypothetical protein